MREIRIERKQGAINEIIYDHTVYYDGRYQYLLSILGLKFLVEKIVQAHATTEYVRFTPFYKNGKVERQVEFDEDYMFYLECRDQFTEEDEIAHAKNCIVKDCDRVLLVDIEKSEKPPQADFLLKYWEDRREKAVHRASVLKPLCRFDDPDTFAKKLFDYLNLLNEIVPEMKQDLLEIHDFQEDDLIFGEFCFEIDSE